MQRIYPNIIYQYITDNIYTSYKLNNIFRNWDYNVYNRFEIFTLKATKIIFLDFDLLYVGNIEELINCTYDFAASPRFSDSMPDYPLNNSFDAGVMVIGEKFINLETKNNLISISQQRIWTSDEPVLNYFFSKYQTLLPKKFNVLTPEYTENKKDARIIQFVGKKKPWHTGKFTDKFDDFILTRNKVIFELKKIEMQYAKELSSIMQMIPGIFQE